VDAKYHNGAMSLQGFVEHAYDYFEEHQKPTPP
jgi:hypothetical protein